MANIIKRVWNQNRMVQIEDLKGMTFQAEQAGHTFEISGIDDAGNTVALTGTPAGVFLRPDNTDVALTCSVSGGKVSATLPANCYDVPGRFAITIFITSGGSKTAIYAAIGTVSRTSSGTAAPGTTQSVVDLINAINAAINSIPASYSSLLADIAPDYSNSALYSVGQYAWYDGDLKRCIVPITTAESYTAAHWTSAVLGQDVSDLKSALTSVQDFAYDLGNVEYSGLLHTGKYCRYSEYNGVPAGGLLIVSTASNGVYTDLIPLGDAKEVSVHTAGSTGTAVIAFYDGSQAYISGIVGEGQTTEKTYKTTTIPANAKYVRFSGYSSSVSVSTVTKCYVGSGDDALLESAIRRKTAIQANTDLNNLKDNGFYLLYSGYTYTNAPSFFTSGQAWLFVYDMINNGSHFRVQLLMKASNGKWAARICSTVGGTETWYSWTEYVTDTTLTTSGKAADAKTTGDALKLALSAKTAIQANTDLNDLKEIGIYLLYSGYTYTNAPAFFTSGSAWLINITDTTGAFVIQMVYKPNGNKWAMRLYNTSGGTGTWYSWNIFDDEYSALSGKKMSIIGDSISTYQGYIPEGYSYYYPSGDVNSVSKTWWKQVADKSGMTVLANASWSGSGVCDDDDDPVNSAKVAYSDARISDLSTVSDDPDIIVVLIGTNDFKHSNELGTLTDGDVPPDGTTSLHTFKEAYSCMINKIHAAYPDAHIYCCTMIPRYDSSTGSTYPIKNSSGIPIHQYNKAIMDMAEWMNCGLIRLDNIFSLQKVYDYTVDHALHPNAAGAKIVGNRILSALIEGEKKYIS